MLASTPSTEPEAEMREGFDTEPSRFRWDRSISAPSANAGVRGRAPSNKVFFATLPSLDAFVHLRSGLRSSVRGVTYSPYHRQEHSFVTGVAITKAAFSRRDWLRAYPLLDEVTRADVGSQ